jgi:hypothetical protein
VSRRCGIQPILCRVQSILFHGFDLKSILPSCPHLIFFPFTHSYQVIKGGGGREIGGVFAHFARSRAKLLFSACSDNFAFESGPKSIGQNDSAGLQNGFARRPNEFAGRSA